MADRALRATCAASDVLEGPATRSSSSAGRCRRGGRSRTRPRRWRACRGARSAASGSAATAGSRCATGPRSPVLAAWHTDPLVEACRWQACEAELLQAVDRLRLVDHDGTLKERPVYLLTSVPLPLPIDEVTTLDALAGEDRLTELLERFGAVPLSAPWLHERAPDLFATEKAAKRWVSGRFQRPRRPKRYSGQPGL